MAIKRLLHLVSAVFLVGTLWNILHVKPNSVFNKTRKTHLDEPKFFRNLILNSSKKTYSDQPKLILHWTGWYNRTYTHESNLENNWYQKHCPVKYGTGIQITMFLTYSGLPLHCYVCIDCITTMSPFKPLYYFTK